MVMEMQKVIQKKVEKEMQELKSRMQKYYSHSTCEQNCKDMKKHSE